MSDLIDRQAAIDALDNAAENWNIAEPYHEGIRAGFRNSARLIMSLPSAQPKCSESPNSSNTVNRIEAEKAICNACGKIDCDDMDTCKKLQLPSAQPELAQDLHNACTDTISRQVAIDALESIDCSDGIGISALKCDVVEDALNAIKALPPAQPERKKGQWMKEDRGHVEYCAVCDQCGFDWIWSDREYFKFCPNCGADMRGEQDE